MNQIDQIGDTFPEILSVKLLGMNRQFRYLQLGARPWKPLENAFAR